MKTFSHKLFLLMVIYLAVNAPANAQLDWIWAQEHGGSSTNGYYDMVYDVAHDASGNIYVAGVYTGANVAIGPNTFSTTNRSAFVGKLNANGQWQWVINTGNLTGNNEAIGTAITVDGLGNVWFGGIMKGAITLPGAANALTGPITSFSGFLYKLNGTNGAVLGQGTCQAQVGSAELYDLAVDSNNDIIAVGRYTGSVGFFGANQLSTSLSDGFIVKLSNAFSYQWFVGIRGNGNSQNENCFGVAVSATNKVLVVGHSSADGGVLFNGIPTTPLGGMDAFVTRIASNGTGEALYSLPTNTVGNDYAYCTALLPNGDVVIGGEANTRTMACRVNPNNGTLVSNYSTAGLTHTGRMYGVDTDPSGNAYFVGHLTGTATFGPSSLNTNAQIDIFLGKVNTTTNQWTLGQVLGGNNPANIFEEARSVAVLGNDDLVIGGTYHQTFTAGGTTLNLTGVSDGILGRIGVCNAPVITQEPPATLASCTGTANLGVTATGTGIAYQWQSFTAPNTWNTINGATGTTYAATASGTYRVVATACGTTVTSTQSVVTVATSPVPVITGTLSLCNGASTTLTASGATAYLWTDGSTTAAITVSPGANTTYAVTATNAAGCTATTNATVTVSANPTATLTGNPIVCTGASTTLTAAGGTAYAWNTGQTTAAITVSPVAVTTYLVTVTNANGCSATAGQTVNALPLPNALITGPPAICAGQSATLTGTGGTGYLWNDGTITANLTVSPLTTTIYTVTVTGANGCTASIARTLLVSPVPNALITGNAIICLGENTSLTADGGTNYLWAGGETTASITVSPAATSAYNVTVTDDNGCTATTQATVTVNALPQANVTGTGTICPGEPTNLTANGGQNYAWDGGQTTAGISVSPLLTTTYSVTVTDANGCTGSTSGTVNVSPAPTAAITGATTICTGGATTLTANGGNTYQWNDGTTTADLTVSPAATTTYDVVVFSAFGCSATATATVTVTTNPVPTITGAGTLCAGNAATLTATAAQAYLWNTGETTAAITVAPGQTTNYTLTVTVAGGCTGSAVANVSIVPVSAGTSNISICDGDTYTVGGQTFTGAGTYAVTLVNAGGCDSLLTLNLTVNPLPSPVVTLNGQAIDAGAGFASYQWLFNGAPINGATAQTFLPAQNGSYSVIVTGANGCTATSPNFNVTFIGLDEVQAQAFALFPNPSTGTVTLRFAQPIEGAVQVFDAQGRGLRQIALGSPAQSLVLDLDGLPNGAYTLRVVTAADIFTQKLMLQR